jgi:hypothetical protein
MAADWTGLYLEDYTIKREYHLHLRRQVFEDVEAMPNREDDAPVHERSLPLELRTALSLMRERPVVGLLLMAVEG